jgi:nicotinamidase-related amidase
MSNANKYTKLSKDDAACLLVDHQAGLISLVQDFSPGEFKNSVLALAACAQYFKLPTILTTSFENGPNGPLVPELKEMFPNAPYIARPGNINAWDNDDFVDAVDDEVVFRPGRDIEAELLRPVAIDRAGLTSTAAVRVG